MDSVRHPVGGRPWTIMYFAPLFSNACGANTALECQDNFLKVIRSWNSRTTVPKLLIMRVRYAVLEIVHDKIMENIYFPYLILSVVQHCKNNLLHVTSFSRILLYLFFLWNQKKNTKNIYLFARILALKKRTVMLLTTLDLGTWKTTCKKQSRPVFLYINIKSINIMGVSWFSFHSILFCL